MNYGYSENSGIWRRMSITNDGERSQARSRHSYRKRELPLKLLIDHVAPTQRLVLMPSGAKCCTVKQMIEEL